MTSHLRTASESAIGHLRAQRRSKVAIVMVAIGACLASRPAVVTAQSLTPSAAKAPILRLDTAHDRPIQVGRHTSLLTLDGKDEFTYVLSTTPATYVRVRRLNERLSYAERLDMPTGRVTYRGELRLVIRPATTHAGASSELLFPP